VLIEFLNSIEQLTSLTVDTETYIRKILINALGEANATPVIDRILVSDNDSGLNRLKWLDGRVIADVIRNEHPQIIATILTYLDSEQSAEVVTYFTAEKRAEVLLRMCNIDTLKPEAISELGEVIEKQLNGQTVGKSASMGGIKSVADVINYLEGGMESEVLDKIMEWDDELCIQIKDNMFIFENLADIDNRSIQTLLKEVSTEQLMLALKGTTELVKEKIFNNMSKRAADLLRDDLSVQGPVKVSDVEKAQKDILSIARKLAEEGSIAMGSKGGDEMI
jgi:flagellar motor switch protein FliG